MKKGVGGRVAKSIGGRTACVVLPDRRSAIGRRDARLHTHVAFPASSRLVIHSVESERMKGKNDKGIVMMSGELRGTCMDAVFAV